MDIQVFLTASVLRRILILKMVMEFFVVAFTFNIFVVNFYSINFCHKVVFSAFPHHAISCIYPTKVVYCNVIWHVFCIYVLFYRFCVQYFSKLVDACIFHNPITERFYMIIQAIQDHVRSSCLSSLYYYLFFTYSLVIWCSVV